MLGHPRTHPVSTLAPQEPAVGIACVDSALLYFDNALDPPPQPAPEPTPEPNTK